MKKTPPVIIGHRGARGIELENSLASLQHALTLDIDAIEFDIHSTSDKELVVMHDASTKRTTNEEVRIADVTLHELQQIRLQNGQTIPTLEEVLRLAADKRFYIDIKERGTAPLLAKLLPQFPAAQVTIVSRLPDELSAVTTLFPDTPTYMYFLKAENPIIRPIHMVSAALSAGATGLGLDKLIINPITYRLAVRRGLRIYVYPLKSLWAARLYRLLYPKIDIMTSHPEKVNRQTL